MNQFLDTKIVQNLELSCSIVTNVNLAYEMLGYIGVVSLLKPKFDGRLFLDIDLYDSPNCEEYNRLLSRNTKSTDFRMYCKAFFTNNETTKWVPFSDSSINDKGLGPEYDECPVIVDLGQYIKDNNMWKNTDDTPIFKATDKYYLVYRWYSDNEDETTSYSDSASMIWPAIPENSITTSRNSAIDDISYVENDPSIIESREVDQAFMITSKCKCNYIVEKVNRSPNIVLDEYAEHNTYRIKFATSNTECILQLNSRYISIPAISGVELIDDDIQNSSYVFQPNTIYLIDISYGFLRVIAESNESSTDNWITHINKLKGTTT